MDGTPLLSPGADGAIPCSEQQPSPAPSRHRSASQHGGMIHGNATVLQTVANSVNLLVGIGMLAYPAALRMGGWAGMGMLVALACGTRYTAALLGRIIEHLGGPGFVSSYTDMARHTFGLVGSIFVSTVFILELSLSITTNLLVFSDSVVDLQHAPQYSTAYVLLGALIVLPSTWIRDLSVLSYLSVLGAVASAVLVGVVLYIGFAPGTGASILHPATTDAVTHALPSLASMGMLFAGLAGHAVFPSIYCSMADRRQFGRALNWAYALSMSVYACIAAAGYCMYGRGTAGQITLNLPAGTVTTVCLLTIALNAVAKYALALGPIGETVELLIAEVATWRAAPPGKYSVIELPADIARPARGKAPASPAAPVDEVPGQTAHLSIELQRGQQEQHDWQPPHRAVPLRQRLCRCWLDPVERKAWLKTAGIRLALTCCVTALAIALPFFDTILGVCGAALSTTVSFTFPLAMYMRLFGHRLGPCSWAAHWAFLISGIAFAIAGTVAAVLDAGETE